MRRPSATSTALWLLLVATLLCAAGSTSTSSGAALWDGGGHGGASLSRYNEEVNSQSDLIPLLEAGKVQSLSLESCTVGTEELAELIVAGLYSNTSQLTHLSIRHCRLDTNVFSAVAVQLSKRQSTTTTTAAAAAATLEELDVGFNSCMDNRGVKQLASIVAQASQLKSLVLDGNVALNPESVRYIVHALRRHPSISRLSLASCGLTDECTEYIAFALKSNKNITSLNLSCNQITEAGLETLAAAMRTGAGRGLVSLDLSHNPLGGMGAVVLARAFDANQLPNLRHLALRDTQAGPTHVEALLRSLSPSSTLESLDLGGNLVVPTPPRSKKSSNSPKKRMEELAAKLVPQLEQAVATGFELFKDLGDQVAEGLAGGKKKKKGARGGKNKTKGRKGGKVEDVQAKSKSKASGKKRGKTGASDAKQEAAKAKERAAAKALLRAQRRALGQLLAAVRRAPRLRRLGLAGSGFTAASLPVLRNEHKKQQEQQQEQHEQGQPQQPQDVPLIADAGASGASGGSGKEEGSSLRAAVAPRGQVGAATAIDIDLHLNDISTEETEAIVALLQPA